MGGELIFIVGEGGPPYGGDTFWRGGMDPGGHPDCHELIYSSIFRIGNCLLGGAFINEREEIQRGVRY